MKIQEMAVSINRAENRFELEIDGKLLFIAYYPKDDHTLVLTHTEVNPTMAGRGFGSQLMEGTFDYIDRNVLKVIPLCSSVLAYIRRHPEYQRLVSPASLKAL
ncbi:GNAT family N-acetyltransferase [Larkinella terrae]|uniref:N-acetyltransferase n=1 Tax=Larkinella terrae TaxID=2025311 RepID=A0A7K0EUC5_9BACT|nr:GNAT family N-acetyltransferase [Larkinella terrae]MRS65176.1 N-acetyltransferase [Larkinella terrae]